MKSIIFFLLLFTSFHLLAESPSATIKGRIVSNRNESLPDINVTLQSTIQANSYKLTNERYFNGCLSRISYASLENPINLRFGVNYLIK